MPIYLSDDDRSFIANALRTAADRYDQCALIASDSKAGIIAGRSSLADQFVYQADRARTLAARLENDDDNAVGPGGIAGVDEGARTDNDD